MMNIIYAVAVLGVLGALWGAILAFASKVFAVEVDPREEAVMECLAGANCGGCGYPGCSGYAAAIVAGEAPIDKCGPGGPEAAAKIGEIMGVGGGSSEKMIAFVPCSGNLDVAGLKFNYTGEKTCQAAMGYGGKGTKICSYACIGYGDCVKACKFGAMKIENGVAKVDREKCVGCMACAEACPKDVIVKVPYSQNELVACRSNDKGPAVIKACKVGCIGCMKCVKECPADAIKVTNFLAEIDPNKCVKCGHCETVCPRKIIKPQD